MENNVENNTETTKKLGGITGKGFMPGVSGNPGGRPKTPLKDFTRERFLAMDENQKLEFLKLVSHETQWKMAEGSPDTKTDITSGGERIDMPIDIEQIKAFNEWTKKQNKQSKK